MDIFIPIVICIIFFILFSICGWCCKRKREGTVYGSAGGGGTNVTITTHTIPNASPVVAPPYPVTPGHPTPHSGAPAPGFTPPYPTHTPYPTGVPVYYPSPMGPSPYPPAAATTPYPPPHPAGMVQAPYPPATNAYQSQPPYMTDHTAQPPSYSEAVSQPPIQPPPPPPIIKEGYAKQSPYNPNY